MDNYPTQIPIFPLSGALLLPSGNLPLNIFEPRYISMIDYVLSNEKFIGMVQPKNDGSKNLFATGCLGKITAYNETEDNRYIINLKGLSKFIIKKEVRKDYEFRMFDVEYEAKKTNFEKFDNTLFNKNIFLKKLKFYLDKKGFNVDSNTLDTINDKSLIIMVAMICPFSVNEKQALVECKDINSVANTVVSLFDFEINQSENHDTIN